MCFAGHHHIYTLCLSHTQRHGRNYEQLKVPVLCEAAISVEGLGKVRSLVIILEPITRCLQTTPQWSGNTTTHHQSFCALPPLHHHLGNLISEGPHHHLQPIRHVDNGVSSSQGLGFTPRRITSEVGFMRAKVCLLRVVAAWVYGSPPLARR